MTQGAHRADPDRIQAASPSGRGRRNQAFVAVLAAALLGASSVGGGYRAARSATIDVGPTDAGYVRDFRDIERDGSVYFRWSSVPKSSFSAPLGFCGPGSIRLRIRRHFEDPALLSVSVNGTLVGNRSVQARKDEPYEIVEFPVLMSACGSDATVMLDSEVTNQRPLGVAVDWMEVRSERGFGAPRSALMRGALGLGLVALSLLVAGASVWVAGGVTLSLAALVGTAFAANPIAAERMLRGGTSAALLVFSLGLLLTYGSKLAGLSAGGRTAVVAITWLTLLSRTAFLHPQAFYPDYRVHALVQQSFSSQRLTTFLDRLFEVQYARSLGLQQIAGEWYPFPYPPGSYTLAGAIGSVLGLGPLDALMVASISAAALIPPLTAAVGLSMGYGEFVAVAGAFFVALQPLLVRRLALGYFPGVMGQFADAVCMLIFVGALKSTTARAPNAALWALALVSTFLVYTQSVANFGLLLVGLIGVETVRKSRNAGGAVRLSVTAALALSAAVGVFYVRYLPVALNILNHRPQPESVVLDRLEGLRMAAIDTGTPETEDVNDPYAGASLSPVRGLLRLGSRVWRFNGGFALAILAGLWLIWRAADRELQNLMLAWAGVPVWISLLAAGLPSPNGFRHLKDLEFACPLMALALGGLTARLWNWRPIAATALTIGWVVFAARMYAVELSDRMVTLAGL